LKCQANIELNITNYWKRRKVLFPIKPFDRAIVIKRTNRA
jgi:hypothetical protein